MDRLRRHPALAHFSAEHLDLLERCSAKLQVTNGDTVIAAGEGARQAFFVQSGAVEVSRETNHGTLVLTRLAAGDMFGEMALVDSAPRSGNVVAVSDLELRMIDPEAIENAARYDPLFEVAIYWTLWKSLAKKLRTNNLKLASYFERYREPPPTKELDPLEPAQVNLAERQRLFFEIGLSNMEVNYLASLAEPYRVKPGQLILQDGEQGESLYAVLKGRIMISKYVPGAGEEALAFLERGDLFGEMALIDGQVRCADAKAASAGAVVLAIRAETLHKLLDIRKASSIRILKMLCRKLAQRLRDGNEKLIGWYMLSAGSHAEGLEEL